MHRHHHQPAGGAHDAGEFDESPPGIGQSVRQAVGHHQVDAVVGQRQRGHVGLPESCAGRIVCRMTRGGRDEFGTGVDAVDETRAARGQFAGQIAFTAPGVQDVQARAVTDEREQCRVGETAAIRVEIIAHDANPELGVGRVRVRDGLVSQHIRSQLRSGRPPPRAAEFGIEV